jgi:polyhydroxyalkanoate synthase
MTEQGQDPTAFLGEMLALQNAAIQQWTTALLPGMTPPHLGAQDLAQWTAAAQRLQGLWLEFQQALMAQGAQAPALPDTSSWQGLLDQFTKAIPFLDPAAQQRLREDGMSLWRNVLSSFGATGEGEQADLPRKDKRFAHPLWRSHPAFAVLHQLYLMLAEQIEASVARMDTVAEDKREQLKFAVRTLVDALSPANFAMTNPVVLERTLETHGQNLVKGMEHLLADVKRGQVSHTAPDAFTLGKDLAITPGKVIHETPLYQLIQYSPATDKVLETPLVIFPPWINRFFILDLTPKKSFVRWCVEQGLSTFIVSWKSADETMADIAWDDYIRAQIECIDFVRERLKVGSVHTVGYCAAGTTLAATLAILARRGEAAKVESATFFTAQVDFENAGELKLLCDDTTLQLADQLASGKGYLEGRYMAAAFNALRGQDLVWNYVVNHYLLGEDYPAFDLLYWNGQTTNLPAKWHHDYTRDLYRDNLLVRPNALSADGTPIDLTQVRTPSYIQAGREDHIAPPESVFRITRHFKGPMRFVLAGSGHIAGVVNPPSANKYQYWTNEALAATLEDFVDGATEHPGSWWPDWLEWLRSHRDKAVPASGKRKPGGKGDKVIEDAPGRYVSMP